LPVNSGIPTIAIDYSGNKWFGTVFGGIAKFDGLNWTVYNTSNSALCDNAIYSVTIDYYGNKWIGTYNGLNVFNENGIVLGVNDKPSTEVTNYSLNQNYPNPFNPSTVINYWLKTAEFVTLKVYDVLGREVATLVNGYQNPGTHNVNFNASTLSSGIYIYTIRAGNKLTQSKKMILMR